jgi:hypothetical protein
MTGLELCEWLEATALGVVVRESLYGFQMLVAAHLLGLGLSVGVLLWVDLRLMGISLQRYMLSAVYRGLAPWFLTGFGVMVASGAALFAGFATAAYGNVFFRIKMTAVLLAAINALVYHFVVQRASIGRGSVAASVLSARLVGAGSIVLWVVVILCGRMMSYTLF